MEGSSLDVLELDVKVSGCLNQAYVAGEETLTSEIQQAPPLSPRFEATPKEKYRIIRNVVVLSFAFMCNYITKYGAGNLQSSINAAHGLGTASLAVTNCGLVLSSATLPTLILRYESHSNVTVNVYWMVTGVDTYGGVNPLKSKLI
jgi:hypothetical protein